MFAPTFTIQGFFGFPQLQAGPLADRRIDLQTSSNRGSPLPNLHMVMCVPPIMAESSFVKSITADIFSTTCIRGVISIDMRGK